ncbi:MAG: Nif11-like leader peptide family natural product precursor [Synechococcaceae cyanobacterium]|nr:Nif11-like leader peptide family natural product precursor [Synechococcaceae cyanobacterium]
MSEEQLKAFLEAVKADAGLQEKLKAAGDADAVVAIAKAAGFVISAEELKRAQAEVSDEELDGVAGSGFGYTNAYTCTKTDNCPLSSPTTSRITSYPRKAFAITGAYFFNHPPASP